MSATLVDLGATHGSDDLGELGRYLQLLVGEPFLFVRMSYGDELTLHFGNKREARNTRLRELGLQYGSVILSARGSGWHLRSGVQPMILTTLIPREFMDHATLISKEELSAREFIARSARVLGAVPVPVPHPPNAVGLSLDFSDGSTLFVMPDGDDGGEEDDSDPDWEEARESAPPLSDWELSTPRGTLRVGPGRSWRFEDSRP